MNADPALRRATYADLEAVSPLHVAEIIDGRLETHRHGAPKLGVTLFQLSTRLEGSFGRSQGWVFLPRTEFHVGDDVLVPDLAGWRRDQLPCAADAAFVTVAPDWVCELLWRDTVDLDRGPKSRIYAEAGVTFLWLLDPTERRLECFSRAGGKWLSQATFHSGEEIRVAPFDAVGFPMDALFPFDEPSSSKTSSSSKTPAEEA